MRVSLFENVRLLVVVFLALISAVSAQAEGTAPLKPTDQVALLLRSVTAGRHDERLRIRAGLMIAPKQVQEITISPAIAVGAQETIDFSKRPLAQRRSQVFAGQDLNERLARFAKEKAGEVSDPQPRMIVQLLRVDEHNKVLEKSKSEVIEFPALDAKGNADGILNNEVTVTLDGTEFKAALSIRRKP